MKKLSLLLLCTILAFSVIAQTEKGYVHLKNGSILKGKYSYFENNRKIKVATAGNIWIFNANEIDSISSKRIDTLNKIEKSPNSSKFFYRSELGVLLGNPDNNQSAPFSISGSANYSLTSKLSAGLGLGIEFFNETYMPVFANFEYRIKQSSSSPYAFLKIGYQVPLEEPNAFYYDLYEVWSTSSSIWPRPNIDQEGFETKGGFLINPGIGYQQMFTQGFGMSFAVGYQYHRLNYEGENSYSLDIDYNRMTVKIGIIFN